MALENKTYRLYALPAGHLPSDTEFYFLLPDIDLIYTTEQPEHAVLIEDPEQIPETARAWLVEAIGDITARYLTENEEALLEGSKTFLEKFEEELEKERLASAKRVKVKVRAASHGNG